MKMSWLWLILLLPVITSCATRPKAEIILPPMPERVEIKEVETVKDMAETINYYDTLVSEWELWGDTVEKILEANSDINYFRENVPR